MYVIYNKRLAEYVQSFSEYTAPGSDTRMEFGSEDEATNWLKQMNFEHPEDYRVVKRG